MNILTTSTGSQELHIIPRAYVDNVTLIIANENTRVETEYNVSASIENGMMVLSEEFSLNEGTFYTAKVKDGDTTLFWGRIFCTDAVDLLHYNMGNNQYTSSADTDGVIII